MIDEDRLLNRIDILENKLQFFQKNAPENSLRDEILKLQEDKCLYQVMLAQWKKVELFIWKLHS